jgi:hypothetical protein
MTSADRGPSFEGRLLPHPDEPAYDQGLQFDVETLVDIHELGTMGGDVSSGMTVQLAMPVRV